jgi:hypothetical protein
VSCCAVHSLGGRLISAANAPACADAWTEVNSLRRQPTFLQHPGQCMHQVQTRVLLGDPRDAIVDFVHEAGVRRHCAMAPSSQQSEALTALLFFPLWHYPACDGSWHMLLGNNPWATSWRCNCSICNVAATDILVIGSSNKGLLKRMTLGSVSDYVIRHGMAQVAPTIMAGFPYCVLRVWLKSRQGDASLPFLPPNCALVFARKPLTSPWPTSLRASAAPCPVMLVKAGA